MRRKGVDHPLPTGVRAIDSALTVGEGQRMGIFAMAGGGKSTLLRILAGEETADAGDVTQRRGLVVAYLPQQLEGDGRDAHETLRAARPDLHELERELGRIEGSLAVETADLDSALDALKDAGVATVALPGTVSGGGPGHARVAFVRDPDGFFVELVQKLAG